MVGSVDIQGSIAEEDSEDQERGDTTMKQKVEDA